MNDNNLEDVTHEEAVDALKSTADVVKLTIAKPSYYPGDLSSTHEDETGLHMCESMHVCACTSEEMKQLLYKNTTLFFNLVAKKYFSVSSR